MSKVGNKDIEAANYRTRLISLLGEIQDRYPEQVIVLNIGGDRVECAFGDVVIYDDAEGRIVIEDE